MPATHGSRHTLPYRRRSGYLSTYGYYGGVVALEPHLYDEYRPYALPQEVVFVREPPRVLDCKRTRQTVTVPSEDGGTRQILVTRC